MLKAVSRYIKRRPVYATATCLEYQLHAPDIVALPLLTPSYQADLDLAKVAEMTASYERHPEFGRFKNTIVVAVRMSGNRDLYLVDGQHRVEMMRRVLVAYPFKVLFYSIESDDQMRALFCEMNYDSHKNFAYVSLGADAARVTDELHAYLSTKPFTKKRGESHLYTVRAFLDIIAPYVAQFADASLLIKDLSEKHDAFLRNADFTNSYAEERTCVESSFIMPIRGCNFTQYLLDPATVPNYIGKGAKVYRTIPLTLKKMVWDTHVGMGVGQTTCQVCKISAIHQISFHCGHIVPKSKGGANTVANLRPICQSCNSSMGTRDMDEFVKYIR